MANGVDHRRLIHACVQPHQQALVNAEIVPTYVIAQRERVRAADQQPQAEPLRQLQEQVRRQKQAQRL